MAYEGPQPFKFTGIAGAVVAQYRFLTIDSAAKAIQAGAEGVNIYGVSQDANGTAIDKVLEVAGPGCITKITAGALLAIEAKVCPDANGKAVAAGAGGTEYWGYLLEASGAENDIVTLMFVPGTV